MQINPYKEQGHAALCSLSPGPCLCPGLLFTFSTSYRPKTFICQNIIYGIGSNICVGRADIKFYNPIKVLSIVVLNPARILSNTLCLHPLPLSVALVSF